MIVGCNLIEMLLLEWSTVRVLRTSSLSLVPSLVLFPCVFWQVLFSKVSRAARGIFSLSYVLVVSTPVQYFMKNLLIHSILIQYSTI